MIYGKSGAFIWVACHHSFELEKSFETWLIEWSHTASFQIVFIIKLFIVRGTTFNPKNDHIFYAYICVKSISWKVTNSKYIQREILGIENSFRIEYFDDADVHNVTDFFSIKGDTRKDPISFQSRIVRRSTFVVQRTNKNS